jgi:indole-3-glycerol phosphate synthase
MSGSPGPDVLAAILAATRRSVAVRRAARPLQEIQAEATMRRPDADRFVAALAGRPRFNIIAECKRRSPSRGVLRADYDPVALARAYVANGAAAVSVLTEPTFFDGSLDHLRAVRSRVDAPLLRKDFIVDEYQLVEARAAGADAVLLIVKALGTRELRSLATRAAALELAALVEVADAEDLAAALDAGSRVVGVNNRDLRTLGVNRQTALDLIDAIPDEVVAVAESGIGGRADLVRLRDAGFDAFLVGERLVTSADPGLTLREWS